VREAAFASACARKQSHLGGGYPTIAIAWGKTTRTGPGVCGVTGRRRRGTRTAGASAAAADVAGSNPGGGGGSWGGGSGVGGSGRRRRGALGWWRRE